jgi:hypothetical protein
MIPKDVLKSVLMPLGVQFVMTFGAMWTLVLYAIS